MSDAAEPDSVSTLRDLPRELWPELARAFRRAIEPLEDAELPAAVRPFRGWKPDRLLAARPSRAVANALASDARLRERVGDALGDKASRARLEALPLGSLVAEVGEQRAAALLVAAGRWDDLATLAAGWVERSAARRRAAAERSRPVGNAAARAREAELVRARRERDEAERARARAESRAQALTASRQALEAEVARLRERIATLEETLRGERAKHRDRLGRARRRVAEAEARASGDTERVRKAARELEQLAGELRALGQAQPEGRGAAAQGAAAFAAAGGQGERGAPLPRTVPSALPGRPCRLPAGLSHEDPDGVRSLLRTPGVLVVLDGYNVTKDPRGVGAALLADQRRWLVQLAAGVGARYRVRTVVVFDSAEEHETAEQGLRGVVVDFAAGEETADDRIVELVRDLPADRPVVVVTSDRELRQRCAALGADVVPSAAFLSVAA